jgi:hypothetical protein
MPFKQSFRETHFSHETGRRALIKHSELPCCVSWPASNGGCRTHQTQPKRFARKNAITTDRSSSALILQRYEMSKQGACTESTGVICPSRDLI